MSSSNAQLVRFEPLRSLAFGSISGSYTAIGTPLAFAARMIIIDNLTNANLIISFDGVNDHMIMGSGSGRVLDFCSNRSQGAERLVLPAGTTVYATGSGASSGSVYVTVIYAQSF